MAEDPAAGLLAVLRTLLRCCDRNVCATGTESTVEMSRAGGRDINGLPQGCAREAWARVRAVLFYNRTAFLLHRPVLTEES
jgi:hypothetical protein